MPITRIESLTFGVADMAAGARFFEDLGLEKRDADGAGARFRTPTNQTITLRPIDDPSLPASPETGPTLREVTWGVDSAASLDAIAAELAKDRAVRKTPDGALHARDETGFAIAFAVSIPTPATPARPRVNNHDVSARLNQRVAPPTRLIPTRIGHVVYRVLPEQREKASAFYLERLGFKLTDRSLMVGDFMRLSGISDHHQLLFMTIGSKEARFDHAALELPGFDDVLWSGGHMKARGWNGTWGPGRQPLGNHIFWHFANPCGGEIEVFTDMDRFDDSWQPVVWEKNGPPPVWMLGEGIPAELREAIAAANKKPPEEH